MICRVLFHFLLIILSLSGAAAEEVLPPAATLAVAAPVSGLSPEQRIDQLLAGAIGKGVIAGGVVLIGSPRETLLLKAYGRTQPGEGGRPLSVDLLFDVASLTKVVAVTPAVLKLAEERRLSLVDPVSKWFPELAGNGKGELLIWHLLTHTSGLDDFSLSATDPFKSLLNGIMAQKLKGELGSRFRYADVNFILLGELVGRASGLPLDQYVKATIYAPLDMRDTGFMPDLLRQERCAPTLLSEQSYLVGRPQDLLARQLGGVAGHAGLFSTVNDLGRYCRMLLNQGELMGKRVLSERAVQQMTAPYFSRSGKVVRGLGWDIASPFSSPKGNAFSPVSFGHTGYSGASLWIDPESELFVVLVTVRLDYKNPQEINALRAELSRLALTGYGIIKEMSELAE